MGLIVNCATALGGCGQTGTQFVNERAREGILYQTTFPWKCKRGKHVTFEGLRRSDEDGNEMKEEWKMGYFESCWLLILE